MTRTSGNFPDSGSDYLSVNCKTCREALSARIDGEPEPAEAVDRHLASCSACRSWYARAEHLRRTMALHAAPPVPDLTTSILERTPAPTGERWPARIALGVVAIAQLTLATAQLLGAAEGLPIQQDSGFMTGHLTRESAAWNLAVGIGLMWAALRTRAAAGQLPLLTGFVLVLTAISTADLFGGDVTVARVLSHLPVVLGLLLLYVVYRQHRDDHEPVTGDALTSATNTSLAAEGPRAVADTPAHGRRTRRPASRYRAA
ncbi:MAG: zf-HC2 domain-containing protein [Sciscionella sp.]